MPRAGKTSSLLFNYMLSTCWGLQPLQLRLLLVVCCIASGMIIASYRSSHFHVVGFIAVIGAGFMAASRWVITERYFSKHERKVSSLQLLYLISPVSVPLMAVLAVVFELQPLRHSGVWDDPGLTRIAVLGTLGTGLTSFLLIALEMAIVKRWVLAVCGA